MLTDPTARLLAALTLLAGLTHLTGCNQTRNQLWTPPGTAAAAAPPQAAHAAAGQVAAPTQAPYVLSAKSGGPFVEFSIYNLGTTDLPVKREHFAIISPNSRDIVPYAPDSTIIDLPQPAVVKPGDTLHGRAMFKAVNNPVGKRLVFKPDANGTFADIIR